MTMRHTLSGDSLGADAMGMGGAIRGAWECACPTETPTSRRLPMNGVVRDFYQDNKLVIGLAAAALLDLFVFKKVLRSNPKNKRETLLQIFRLKHTSQLRSIARDESRPYEARLARQVLRERGA
jgi:hypothetical protein